MVFYLQFEKFAVNFSSLVNTIKFNKRSTKMHTMFISFIPSTVRKRELVTYKCEKAIHKEQNAVSQRDFIVEVK